MVMTIPYNRELLNRVETQHRLGAPISPKKSCGGIGGYYYDRDYDYCDDYLIDIFPKKSCGGIGA